MSQHEKPLHWLGTSHAAVQRFPEAARRLAGYELGLVQEGEEPTDWRPMTAVGPGVREIRVHAGGEFRVLYVAQFEDAVFVLHAFEKKTRKTRQADIELARSRLRSVGRRFPGGAQ